MSHPEAVLQAPESNGREHLCKPYGTSAGPLQYLSAMKELAKALGVAKIKCFRIICAICLPSVYYERFQDIVKLADILGHSNVNTTRIYTTATAGTISGPDCCSGTPEPIESKNKERLSE